VIDRSSESIRRASSDGRLLPRSRRVEVVKVVTEEHFLVRFIKRVVVFDDHCLDGQQTVSRRRW